MAHFRRIALRRLPAFVLFCAIFASLLSGAIHADTDRTGHLLTSGVRTRTGPGTNQPSVHDSAGKEIQLSEGFTVTVHGEAQASVDSNPTPWYSVTYTYGGKEYSGYIRSDFLQVDEPETPPDDPGTDPSVDDPAAVDPNDPVEAYGYTTQSGVHVRQGPGTKNYAMLADSKGASIELPVGFRLNSVGEAVASQDGDSYQWYPVSLTYENVSRQGYIRGDLIRVVRVVTEPVAADFEESIAAFPEDYKALLRAVHEEHPTWKFEILDTGLDWADVQKAENQLGWSATISEYASHRSTAEGAYDWTTDTFLPIEGNKFFQAAPEVVAYYMDPRNFLNSTDIFQFEKLSYDPTTQTLEGAQGMLVGSFMEKTKIKDLAGNDTDYAHAFMDAAAYGNVSLYHLIARCIQEVGRSGTATGTIGTVSGYVGIYNYFSIGATNGALPGLQYASKTDEKTFRPWNTPYKAIMGGGVFIGSSYISKGQDTLYLQKFCVIPPNLYWHQYMSYIAAAQSEALTMRRAYEKLGLLDTEFTFRIPVYENMPETPCEYPAPAGSPNNLLKSLSVANFNLTPTFDYYTTDYSLILTGDISSVTVSAAAVSSTASLSGDLGKIKLKTGENDLKIVCTSASGDPKTYTIHIVLNGQGTVDPDPDPPAPDDPIGSGWNPTFRWEAGCVAGIAPGTTVEEFIQTKLGLYGEATASFTDAKGAPVASGAIRTGYRLVYFNGETTATYPVLVFGDVNGDSEIDVVDLLIEQKIILDLYTPTEDGRKAADVNHDGSIDVVDLLIIQKHILALFTIVQ